MAIDRAGLMGAVVMTMAISRRMDSGDYKFNGGRKEASL